MILVLFPCLAVGVFCSFRYVDDEVFGQTLKGVSFQRGRFRAEGVDRLERRAALEGGGSNLLACYRDSYCLEVLHVGECVVAERGYGTHVEVVKLLDVLVAVHVACDVRDVQQVYHREHVLHFEGFHKSLVLKVAHEAVAGTGVAIVRSVVLDGIVGRDAKAEARVVGSGIFQECVAGAE